MHLDHRFLHRVLALALLLALALALPPARPALAAATVMVDPTANDANDNNDGKCSLWEALQAISETAPGDNKYNQCDASGGAPYTIKFKSSGKLKVLNGQLPFVTKNISLVGPVIIEGNGNDNILVVASSGILSLTNLTMTKGNPAILNNSPSGVVNIAGCSFLDNKNDGDGGAISSSGKLNIAGSVFTGNSSDGSDGGGAIWATGSEALAVAGTAFNGNIAKRSGGAIYATAPANLVDVVFNGNIANGLDPNNNGTDGDPADEYDTQGGGAVFSRNDGSNGRKMTLTRVVFNGNITGKGHGGGIYNNINSIMEIQDSAFNGNLTGKPPSDNRHGGAIVNFGGKMTVTRSTLLNNAAQGDGGGIANDRSGDLTLSNVSMTANAATGRGGAIFDFNTQQGSNIRPKLTALNVTLALNAALDEGGGIYAQDPTSSHPEVVLLANTIVANSDGAGLGGNCAGEGVTSLGHNLDSGTSCGLDGAGDLSNADPKLNTPAFHGGAISSLLSQKPDPGSAAIDAGDAQVCADAPVSSQDVRGEARPQGAVCDIGAFEAAAAVAGFGSAPVQPGPISFGNVVFGAGQNADISVFNTGNKTLELSDPQISGADAASFALITSFPMNVNAPTPLTLRCAPTGSTPGLRSATFTFKTNDPNNSTVSYNLLCNAVPQPVAGFSSTPPAPGPLDFGDVIIGQTKNGTISIKENGTATLTANSTPLGGADPGDFSIGGGFNLTLPDGAAPVAVAVSCTPTAPGIRSATLTVSTNDPTQPTVTFNLSCTGKTPPTPPLAGPGTNVVNSSTNIVAGPYGLAISPDGRHVYAADDGDDLVSAFARNPATGNLSFLDEYQDEFTGGADLDGARIVTVSGDGENVYVTGWLDDGITAYTRDLDTGGLTVLGSVKDNDGYGCFPGPCDGTVDRLAGAYGIALSPDGQHVYISSITDSAITVLRRGLDGRLKTTTPLPFGAHFIQTITHASLTGAYGIALSPDGAYLYATGYTSDSLLVFKRNANDGKLSYVTTYNATTIAGLNGVFRVTLSPDGNHVYTASYDGDAVTAFSRNPADGKLTHLATYADGVGGVDGLDSASSVAVSPDGTYLFATGYTDNAVAVFARDSQSGLLTFAQVIKRDGAGQPPLQGARDVAVAPDGRSVIATGRLDKRLVVLPFANPKPTLDSLGPASVTATGGALTLTVNGSGFVPGAKVRWNNAVDLPTEFVNSSQLKASVGAGLLTTPGDRPVTAVNPAPGGGTSNALTFVITAQGQNPLPSIDELNPAGAAAGDPALTLTVKGANFIPGAKVLWNGDERPTTYVSGTTLQAQVLVSDVAQPGDAAVTVVNPAPGGGTSNAVGFGVAAPGQNPVPAITSLSPASIIAGANGSLTLTIAGTNFLPDSQAQWNGQDRPTTFVGAGELRMEVSGADLITPGDSSVQVINPAPGGGPSNVAGFAIGAVGENLVPALTRVAGLARNQDGTLTLTLDGSGFVGGVQAKWNGANRPTALVNSTRLTMTISVGDFAGGSAVITVTNPAPGGGLSNELLYVFTRIGMPLVRR